MEALVRFILGVAAIELHEVLLRDEKLIVRNQEMTDLVYALGDVNGGPPAFSTYPTDDVLQRMVEDGARLGSFVRR